MTAGERERGELLVRPYVITNGRTRPAGTGIGPRTMLAAARRGARARPPASPDERALLRICARRVPVSEAAAGLGLPVGVVSVLAADLADSGWLIADSPAFTPGRPGREVLERVLDGLRRL